LELGHVGDQPPGACELCPTDVWGLGGLSSLLIDPHCALTAALLVDRADLGPRTVSRISWIRETEMNSAWSCCLSAVEPSLSSARGTLSGPSCLARSVLVDGESQPLSLWLPAPH
jgi:hypothetical protein